MHKVLAELVFPAFLVCTHNSCVSPAAFFKFQSQILTPRLANAHREAVKESHYRGEYRRDGESQTEARAQAGNVTMIMHKMNMAKHHRIKDQAPAQGNWAQVGITHKNTTQGNWAPVVGTTKQGRTLSRKR